MGTAAAILGKWMAATWQWDAFVTLTFRDPPPTPENAARGYTRIGARGGGKALLGWLHQSVVPRAPGAFWWFVEEPHQFRSTPHFHGLLGGVRGVQRKELWADWHAAWGMARVEPVGVSSTAKSCPLPEHQCTMIRGSTPGPPRLS